MASGSFSNGSGQNCKLIISWSSSKGTGGSTVSATLVGQNQNNAYFNARVYNYGITINGSSNSGSNAALSSSTNGSANFISHSVWVGYTGNKSITISGYANFGDAGIWSLSNQTISGTATLDKVGSAPTMGAVTSPGTGIISETTNTITVTWNKATSYNNACTYGVGVSINGGAYSFYYPDSNINTTSWTYTIPNKTQGTTYKFCVWAANDVATSGYQYSGTVTLNSLSAPTIGDLSVFNPYVNSTYTVPLSGGSQASGEGFTRRCNIHVDGNYKYSGSVPSSNGNTSVNIPVNASDIASDLGTRSYSSSTKFTIVAWTENSRGTRSTYVSKTFTVNLNSDGNATPTLGAPTLSGGAFNNPSTCFIKGVSTLNVTSATGSLRRAPSGTTLSYKISITGGSTVNSTSASYSNLSAGVKTITVTCTDSRGLSTSVTKQCRIQDYAVPSIYNISLARLDNPNTSAKFTYSISYSPIYQYTDVNTAGNQLNGISSQQYSLNSGSWTDTSSGTTLTGLSTDSTYTLKLRVTDSVGKTTTSSTYTIPTVAHLLSMRKNRLGINCVPQEGYALDVAGKTRISGNFVVTGDITIPMERSSVDSSVPVAGDVSNVVSDIATLKNAKSVLGSALMDGTWYGLISARHRNGSVDGTSYGLYLRSPLKSSGNLSWGKQYDSSSWQAERTILDSSNYTSYTPINIKDSSGTVLTFNTNADNTSDSWLLVGKNGEIQHRRVETLPFLSRYSPNGYEPIRYFAGDKNGDTMVVGLGGSVVIGSGESAQTCIDQWSTAISDNESFDITSDKYVTIHTNLQNGYSNQKTFTFKQDGTLTGGVFGWGYTEGNGIYGFADGGTYLEIRTAAHGAKGINWWDSDASLKKNIKNTEVRYALEKISQLKHIEFDWKENDSHVDLGYVADDVEKILPCLVFDVAQYDEDGKPNGEVIKNIDYRTMIPLVTMGIQELIEERDLLWTFDEEAANCIIKLREEVDSLKSTVNELKAEIESLKKAISA